MGVDDSDEHVLHEYVNEDHESYEKARCEGRIQDQKMLVVIVLYHEFEGFNHSKE